MRVALLCVILALVDITPAAARQFEVSASLGATPYADRESIAYRLAAPPFLSSLVSFDTSAPIDVRTDGGVVLGFGVGWFFSPNASLEGRLDSVDLNVDNTPVAYSSRLRLPGIAEMTQQVTVGPARLTFHRPLIASMTLRVRRGILGRRLGWTPGAGLSVLPGSEVVATEPIAAGPLSIGDRTLLLPIAALSSIELELRGRTPVRAGANAVTGLNIQLADRIQIRPELRYILLQPMRVEWDTASPSTPLGLLGASVGEPLTGLTPLQLRSDFLMFQTALVLSF